MTTSLRDSPSGRLSLLSTPLAEYGLQTAWAIDATLGDDAGPGTPSHPLRTMGEFNSRLSGNTLRVVATLQLVGDVTDEPLQLVATRFARGASLTVNGTRTILGTATITAVSTLNTVAGIFPWQLDTTGFDWTTLAAAPGPDVQLRGFSGGAGLGVGFVSEVVSATRVDVGPIETPGLAAVTPVVGDVITISSLSQASMPCVSAEGANVGISSATPQLLLQDLLFTGTNNLSLYGGLWVHIFGCAWQFVANSSRPQIATSCFLTANRWSLIGTSITVSQGLASRQNLQGLLCIATGSNFVGWTNCVGQFTDIASSICRHIFTGGNISGSRWNTRNTPGPFAIQNQAQITMTSIISGSNNTGNGVDVFGGRLGYSSGNKPTISAGNDARIGGTVKTWAQVPFINLDATVPAALTGNGAAILQDA
jgi:hypothetical protein